MVRVTLALATLMAALAACQGVDDDAPNSSSTATDVGADADTASTTGAPAEPSLSIRDNPTIVTNPFADVEAPEADEWRVDVSTPTGEVLERLPLHAGSSTAFLWGLRELTTYRAHVEARYGETWLSGESVEFTTPPLPPGMPKAEVVVHDPSRAHEGIVILPTMAGGVQTYVGFDPEGHIVWYYQTGFEGVNFGGDLKVMDDGRLFLFRPGGAIIIDPWGEKHFGSNREHHHDITPLPNGNLLMLRSRVETLDVFELGGPVEVRVDGIVEVDPEGAPVHSWWASEHIDHQSWPSSLGKGQAPYDWTHSNAVYYQADRERILLSMRHQHAIYAIKWPEGVIQWELGALGDFEMPAPIDWFYNQHSPEPQADGTLLLYDNGNERPTADPYSRAVLLDLDETAMTAEVVWDHHIQPFTPVQGDADRLPNGNVLSSAGGVLQTGNPVRIIEATADTASEVVWELVLPESLSIYRATHLSGF